MVRRYVRKKGARWDDRDKRMTQAVQLRAQGLSLRQIAAELVVHHQTVANDLARWDRETASVTRLPVESGRLNAPRRGRDSTPGFDTASATVLPIRRTS